MRTAAAKGLDSFTVIMKHGFKNALIPLVTMIALSAPVGFGGAVVTETIFAWPGMGGCSSTRSAQFDFAVLMGYLCIVAFLVVVLQPDGRRLLRVARSAREVLVTASALPVPAAATTSSRIAQHRVAAFPAASRRARRRDRAGAAWSWRPCSAT